jgi:hypothetical protein
MKVKELLKCQKYYTPIRICGGSSPQTFFSWRIDDYVHERYKAFELFGDYEVSYFYYETNLKMLRWLCRHMPKLFYWINPRTLVIELCNCNEVDTMKKFLEAVTDGRTD